MATEWRLWNPPKGRRKRRRHARRRGNRRGMARRCPCARCRNPFLTLTTSVNPRRRRRHRRGHRNPTGIPYSGPVLRPRGKGGSRRRYTRWKRGLTRSAFGRFPRQRGRGLYRLARSLSPRGGRRKLAA